MAYQYTYTTYDFHWPVDQQERMDQMVADGWQVNTALPNAQELHVLWQRELPAAEKKPIPKRVSQKDKPVDEELVPVSGGLHDHEGQAAR